MEPGAQEGGPQHERPHQAEGGGGADTDQAGCRDEGEAEVAGAEGGAEDEEPGAAEAGVAAPDRA